MCDQEEAVKLTFHFERNSFFYLSALMVNVAFTSLYFTHRTLNTDSDPCPLQSETTPKEKHL